MSDLEQLLEFLRQGIDVKQEIRWELQRRRKPEEAPLPHQPPVKLR